MPRARSNVEHKSLLPTFDVQPSNDFPTWVRVTCAHDDCPSKTVPGSPGYFLVHKVAFQLPVPGGGPQAKSRPCPYCFRVSYVPALVKKRGY